MEVDSGVPQQLSRRELLEYLKEKEPTVYSEVAGKENSTYAGGKFTKKMILDKLDNNDNNSIMSPHDQGTSKRKPSGLREKMGSFRTRPALGDISTNNRNSKKGKEDRMPMAPLAQEMRPALTAADLLQLPPNLQEKLQQILAQQSAQIEKLQQELKANRRKKKRKKKDKKASAEKEKQEGRSWGSRVLEIGQQQGHATPENGENDTPNSLVGSAISLPDQGQYKKQKQQHENIPAQTVGDETELEGKKRPVSLSVTVTQLRSPAVTHINGRPLTPQSAVFIAEITELRGMDFSSLPNPGYMKAQTDVSERMREILVDWLRRVHKALRMRVDTLHLCVNLLDRFLSKRHVMRENLQLVGCAALLVAAKYEEIYPPDLNTFCKTCDNAYSLADLVGMEGILLTTLEYRVQAAPTAMQFASRMLRLCRPDGAIQTAPEPKLLSLTTYLMDVSLQKYTFLKYQPLLLASSALLLARSTLNKQDMWPAKLLIATDLSKENLLEHGAVRDLIQAVAQVSVSEYGSVVSQYQREVNECVSLLPLVYPGAPAKQPSHAAPSGKPALTIDVSKPVTKPAPSSKKLSTTPR